MKIGYLMQAGVPEIRYPPYSGPANHVKQVFQELKNLGDQLCILAVFDNQLWKSEDLIHFEKVTVRYVDRGFFHLLEKVIRRIQSELKLPYAAFFESLRFSLACKQELEGFDLLYERMGWMGYGGSLASILLKVPLVLEVNGDHISELEKYGMKLSKFQRWLSLYLTKKAVQRASHIVASGEGWQQRFIERWGTNPSRVSVVENGSEVVGILQRNELHSFCASEISNKQVNLIYVGGFEPWHGLQILVSAVARVIDENKLIHLTLIGSGNVFDEITKLISELDIEEYVTLTGSLSISQISKLLAESDIGMSPYCGWKEYSGLKLFDYKAAGLATIASGENGKPGVIEDGKTGLIVPPCDVERLCEAIAQLTSEHELRRRMGREARIQAENFHSWSHTARNLQKIFLCVVNQNDPT